MRRFVLDTSVIASAFCNRRSGSFELIRLVPEGTIRVLATPPLFLEYEDVLKRDEQRSVSGFTLNDVDDILAALAVWIEPVDVRLNWRPQLSDPKDEMVLEAAINGQADAIVTFNRRDFERAAPRFGIRVIDPASALKEIRQ